MIYKILCKDELIKDCYIGSTFDFNARYKVHKSDCKYIKSKVYQFIRNNGGFDNFKFEILLSFDCDRRSREIEIKEQEFLDELKPSLNSNKAYQTEEEKKEYEKEYNKEWVQKNEDYFKDYYEKNKAKLSEKFNCDCGGKYTYENKSSHEKTRKHQKFLESQEIL